MSLFEHTPHPHTPRNVNEIHAAKQATAPFNDRLAVTLTRIVSTMWTAYFFVCLALLGFPALSAWLGPSVAIYVVWFSQTFLQLVFLPVLSVGTGILSKHQETEADESFARITKLCDEINQIAAHLAVQDEELTKQTAMLAEIARGSNGSPERTS